MHKVNLIPIIGSHLFKQPEEVNFSFDMLSFSCEKDKWFTSIFAVCASQVYHI